MKKNKLISDKNLNKTIKILVIVLLVLLIIFMSTLFKSFWNTIFDSIVAVLVPVFCAWLIGLVVFPIIKWMEKLGVGPRGVTIAVVYIVCITLAIVVVAYGTPFLYDEINTFAVVEVPKLTAYIQGDLRNEFILGQDMYDQIADYLQETQLIENAVNGFLTGLSKSLPNTITTIITLMLILPILLIYYLKDYEIINNKLRSIIPVKYEKDASELALKLNNTVGAYVRGQLLLMFSIGTVAVISYRIIGLKYFLVFGIIVGLTNIIPYFGAIIAAIPPIVFAMITGDNANPIYVLLVNLILQFVEGNILQPVIMGKQLEMHPILIILAIMFFGTLFGTLGVVFAAPLAATCRVLFEFFSEKRKEYLLREDFENKKENKKSVNET